MSAPVRSVANWLAKAARLLPAGILALTLFHTQACFAASHKAATEQKSDFARAVQAVKDKNYQLALNLFELEAEKSEYEAMYNLALLLKAGKGRPQNYVDALYWAYLSQLGGIELASDIIDDLADILNEAQRTPILERVEAQLLKRIDTGDFDAIPQYASYFTTLLEEPDYAKAYQWYAIAVALGLPEMTELRDDMESEIEVENIPELQAKTAELFNMLMNGQAIQVKEMADES
jgi:TPR repeat protein